MDNQITMQHVTKGPAGFSHAGVSVASDDDGVISIPAHLTGHAKAHGFSTDVAPKAPKAVLAKAAKGGEPDEIKKDAEPAKVKDAKAAKGGAE